MAAINIDEDDVPARPKKAFDPQLEEIRREMEQTRKKVGVLVTLALVYFLLGLVNVGLLVYARLE